MSTLPEVEPHLTEDAAEDIFGLMLDGKVSDDDIARFLIDLSDRGETAAEITGAARALRSRLIPIDAPENAIDVCGTGGDGHHTLNVSTAVSLVVAACGVPVAKHGNRSASSRSGAADVLEALGVNINLAPEAAASVLATVGLVFLFAQTYHPAMKHVGGARKQIGRRTIFNLLGPLASPAQVRRQLVGVFSSDWLVPYAEALKALGSESAFIVHGRDGLDEISISGPTQIAVLDRGAVAMCEITPEDAGLIRWPLAEIKGGDAAHNAAALRHLLEGDAPGAYHQIVQLNAAAALIVAGKVKDLRDGAEMANDAIRSGRAHATFNKLLLASNA
jgi:anthranilate phosphoribosyltransferase